MTCDNDSKRVDKCPPFAAAPDPIAALDVERDESSSAPAAGEGTFFHEDIDLRDPEGGLLTERLVEIYDQVRPRKRKKGRDTLRLRLRRLVANAMRGHYFRDVPSVLYFRGAEIKEYNDKPWWMKHGALGDVVDALVDAGLVGGITGARMPWNSAKRSTASSYWASDELVRMALVCGVTADSLDRPIPADGLVQLFAPKPQATFRTLTGEIIRPGKGQRIWFEPTAETREWTATLEAVNAFYRSQEITVLPVELDNWLAGCNADPDRKGAPYRLPETFARCIYRVFNNGDEADPQFGEGGRLFGGWWMNATEQLRRTITINGKTTTELDYANCHLRMLYHKRGLSGDGELYRLPEIAAYEAEKGLAADTFRPCVKWLTQILINGRGRPEAVNPPKAMAFPPDIPIKQIVGFIEAMHHPIADAFRTGAGLGLMRLESDIALEIVGSAMAEGWTVLSVHDSFISTIDLRDRLKAMMVDAYVRRLGKEPIVKG